MDDTTTKKILVPPEILEEQPLPGQPLVDSDDLLDPHLSELQKLVKMLIVKERMTVPEYVARNQELLNEGISSFKMTTDMHNMRKALKKDHTFTWAKLMQFLYQTGYSLADVELTLVRKSTGKVVTVTLAEADDYRRTHIPTISIQDD